MLRSQRKQGYVSPFLVIPSVIVVFGASPCPALLFVVLGNVMQQREQPLVLRPQLTQALRAAPYVRVIFTVTLAGLPRHADSPSCGLVDSALRFLSPRLQLPAAYGVDGDASGAGGAAVVARMNREVGERRSAPLLGAVVFRHRDIDLEAAAASAMA